MAVSLPQPRNEHDAGGLVINVFISHTISHEALIRGSAAQPDIRERSADTKSPQDAGTVALLS